MGYLAPAFHILLDLFCFTRCLAAHCLSFLSYFQRFRALFNGSLVCRGTVHPCLSLRPCPRRWSSSDNFYCCTVGRAWNQHDSLRCAFEDSESNEVTWHFRPRLFAGAIGNPPLTIFTRQSVDDLRWSSVFVPFFSVEGGRTWIFWFTLPDAWNSKWNLFFLNRSGDCVIVTTCSAWKPLLSSSAYFVSFVWW